MVIRFGQRSPEVMFFSVPYIRRPNDVDLSSHKGTVFPFVINVL